MTTATRRLLDKSLDFTSNNPDKLLPALRLVFDEDARLYWSTADDGIHIVGSEDAINIYGGLSPWQAGSVSEIAASVEQWLEHLSYDEARRICKSMPSEEAYTADPKIHLSGYRITLSRQRRVSEFQIIVIPAWV